MSIFVPPRLAPVVPFAEKAGPLGPGAGVLQTEYPLLSLLGRERPQDKMLRAASLGFEVPWIRAAERVIGQAFATVPWHLEDESDVEIDDEYGNAAAQEARLLMEQPQAKVDIGQPMTRSNLWRITSRHMGLCGSSFWFRDQINAYGIPAAYLYIAPWRMTPDEDANGNLQGWWLDRSSTKPGVHLRLDQVRHFMFEPPDSGHFGVGLIESALAKAQISGGLDRHLAQVISAGGRLSGFLSPKAGESLSGDQYKALIADFRTVVEQPDAAKRLQVIRGPVEFQKTTMTPQELAIRDLMTGARDDLLSLWGVPVSKLGVHDRGSGLGTSTVTDKDDETLWKNGVGPRLDQFREALQYGELDRFEAAGAHIELEIDGPVFDDEGPAYEIASKAREMPLRNSERRELIGLEPFGELVLGESGQPLDDEVWLPATLSLAYSANEGADNAPAPVPTALVPFAGQQNDRAAATAGETTDAAAAPQKAKPVGNRLHASLVRLRTNLEKTITPHLRASAADVLAEQRSEIVAKLRKNAGSVAATPNDPTMWFDAPKWDRKMAAALAPGLMGAAQSVNLHLAGLLPAHKADPVPGASPAAGGTSTAAVDRVMARSATRVTRITETTRDQVQTIILRALDAGWSIMQAADYLEALTVPEGLAAIDLSATRMFDDYRAEMIARTELMDAYNQAALGTYEEAGLTDVQAIDGDEDEECAARDGQVFSIDEADTIEDHPNGTLDWVPVIPDFVPESEGKAMLRELHGFAKAIAERPAPPAPVFNIHTPDVTVHPAEVTVNPAPVTISEGAVQVHIEGTKAAPIKPTRKTVVRDEAGRIVTVIED